MFRTALPFSDVASKLNAFSRHQAALASNQLYLNQTYASYTPQGYLWLTEHSGQYLITCDNSGPQREDIAKRTAQAS